MNKGLTLSQFRDASKVCHVPTTCAYRDTPHDLQLEKPHDGIKKFTSVEKPVTLDLKLKRLSSLINQAFSSGVNTRSNCPGEAVKLSFNSAKTRVPSSPGAKATSYLVMRRVVTARISIRARCLPTQEYGPKGSTVLESERARERERE